MVSAWMIASVSGIVNRHVVPLPSVDSTSTDPPIRSMLGDRRDTGETCHVVE
jgi:hypothetical protein